MGFKRKAGIDVGGTLIKAAIRDADGLKFRSFMADELGQCARWLNDDLSDTDLCLTGGGASMLQEKLLQQKVHLIPEFEASCSGVRFFLKKASERATDRFILTNCGTGTSIHLVDGNTQRRIGGSGIGGGTLIGLSELLTGKHHFRTLMGLADHGNRDRIDLTVARIYEGAVPPIPGDLTASNFGLASRGTAEIDEADKVSAVIGLVAETITTLSIFAAEKEGVRTAVYIGSSFAGNPEMRAIVMRYSRLYGIKPVIPENGQYSGAVGALLRLEH
ncbi:type II pantothenate kinase [Sporolactobacillus pectinivorans]|uniref:type II pantothenate kinase n=1 Tax=Sporolactobacillus pectinivorans TaxID=1591408 RepID=UPI000C26230A|nr:type II pantothenate kinase [Sporolactobacillus pectinivorans]